MRNKQEDYSKRHKHLSIISSALGCILCVIGLAGSLIEAERALPANALRIAAGLFLLYFGSVSKNLYLALSDLPADHPLHKSSPDVDFLRSKAGVFFLSAVIAFFIIAIARICTY